MQTRRRRAEKAVAIAAAVAVVGFVGWQWAASLPPTSYSVLDMGHVDAGGAAHAGHHAGAHRIGVDSLTEPDPGPADVEVTLTAREEPFRLGSGRVVDRFTLNGTSPGPVIRVEQGQLLQVRLRNESVPDGVALHWHGLDVPNAMDGVAGVTQDAVPVGGEFTYRFRVDQVGTYWYHSHQLSHEQVQRGLLGALVVTPPQGLGDTVDALALVHLYDGVRTINGAVGDLPLRAAPGDRVRVRVVNTDGGPMPVWVGGAPFRAVAIDGTDLHGPTDVADVAVLVTAGGRADLEIVMPADGSGVRVEMAGSAALVLGADAAPTPRPARDLDLLTYGTPAPLGFDPAAADRRFGYEIGRRPGFVNGVPGLWWTINGHLFPDVPMFVVTEGDVVHVHIVNTSGEVHPMHLHGHHAAVLSRDGIPVAGSPWWVDSLDVGDGETYEIAFVADNPGIWMDHCHNLRHAAEGLIAHLMYEGVTTPYLIGGPAANHPE